MPGGAVGLRTPATGVVQLLAGGLAGLGFGEGELLDLDGGPEGQGLVLVFQSQGLSVSEVVLEVLGALLGCPGFLPLSERPDDHQEREGGEEGVHLGHQALGLTRP